MRTRNGFSTVEVMTAAVFLLLVGAVFCTYGMQLMRVNHEMDAYKTAEAFVHEHEACLRQPVCYAPIPETKQYAFALEKRKDGFDLTLTPKVTTGVFRYGDHAFYFNERGVRAWGPADAPPRPLTGRTSDGQEMKTHPAAHAVP